jgi:hypothetical protein
LLISVRGRLLVIFTLLEGIAESVVLAVCKLLQQTFQLLEVLVLFRLVGQELVQVRVFLDAELFVFQRVRNSVHLRPVQTQARPLLELHVAPVDLAGVRVELSVRVDVVNQILLLRK